MATKEARGTKRTCQSCESRFYDLNRDPIICPVCEEEYKLAPVAAEAVVVEKVVPEPAAPKPKPVEEEAADGEEVTDDDALVSLEDADAELGADDDASEDDNTFLETDDEDADPVSGIIGEVSGDEEES